MSQLLNIRSQIIILYNRNENLFKFCAKTFLYLIVFSMIFSSNYHSESVNSLFDGFMSIFVVLGLSMISASLPQVFGLLITTFSLALASSSALSVSLFAILFGLIVIIFYARLAKEESFFIIFTIMAFALKVPFLVPLVAGLFFSFYTIIPIAIGTFSYYSISATATYLQTFKGGSSVADAASDTISFFSFLTSDILLNMNWVLMLSALVITLCVTMYVKSLEIEYSIYKCVIAGGIAAMVCMLILSIVSDDFSFFVNAIFIVISCAIALVLSFLNLALDYDRMEKVQFSDDYNYYYVTVVPKYIIDGIPQDFSQEQKKHTKNNKQEQQSQPQPTNKKEAVSNQPPNNSAKNQQKKQCTKSEVSKKSD